MPTPTPIPVVSNLLSDTSIVVDGATSWISTISSKIASTPLLVLACVAVPLCGLGVGLLSRLLRKRV